MARAKDTEKPAAEAAPKKGVARRVLGWFGWIAIRATILVVLLAAVGAGLAYVWYQREIVADPGPELDRQHIMSIIAEETAVTYNDGTTRVGVFFADEHRQYVGWEEIPDEWTIAIVASEDGHFWTHWGIDPKHIGRAFYQNFTQGELVAGGSTLTQQTAKNLYYRPDRSVRSKLTELEYSLKLEEHYTKRDILTFYANQFHVTGNGRGLAIAARYFFDKEPEELTLAESAFLAGSVKGPNNYDPFIGDSDRRAAAAVRAHDRTMYVLRRIIDEPSENLAGEPDAPDFAERLAKVEATKKEAQKLLDDGFELPFKKGTFRYDKNAVLDEVARRLKEPPFDAILSDAGITDPATAGIVVVTTLDPLAQREAEYSLWHHLTEVGTELEGKKIDDFVLAGSRPPVHDPQRPIVQHEFRLAAVDSVVEVDGRKTLRLDLGGQPCMADRDAIVRVASVIRHGQKQDRSAKVQTADVDAIVDALKPGTVITTSIRTAPENGALAVCDLEVRPELQGAVVVLQDGEIRAMVGGNDNKNFNRATALRQMGSTWKPIVYHAALQLGWQPTDSLDNRRNVFPFSTTYYWPSPDHEPHDVVSMSWAGVNSENLASVWLLYHLTDRLDGEKIRELAEATGLARGKDETAEAYRTRIQKAGVLPTQKRVEEALFLQSRREVWASIGTSPHPEDELAVESMLYGWGFAGERDRAGSTGWKQRSLDASYTHMRGRLEPCDQQYDALRTSLESGFVPPAVAIPDLTVRISGDVVEVACGGIPAGFTTVDDSIPEFLGTAPTAEIEVPSDTDEPERGGGFFKRLFGGGGEDLPEAPAAPVHHLAEKDDVMIDDYIHAGTLRTLVGAVERRVLAREASGDSDLYDPEIVYWHQDFRVLLGMKIVEKLAHEYGVRTDVQTVLAMPLGASEITLEEATSVYQGLVTGQAWDYPGDAGGIGAAVVPGPIAPALLIKEIRDVDGNVLYRAEPKAREVASPAVAGETAHILRNVVRFGTGRRALDSITVGPLAVPVGGKTGTTNDFRNVAFLGYAPMATSGGFTTEHAWTVGVYVGYDDNRSLTNGGIKLAGASGALPAWIGTVQGLAKGKLLGEPSAEAVGHYWPLDVPGGLTLVPVDSEVGLPSHEERVIDETVDPAMLADVLVAAPAAVGEGTEPAPVDVHLEYRVFPEREAPTTEEVPIAPE